MCIHFLRIRSAADAHALSCEEVTDQLADFGIIIDDED